MFGFESSKLPNGIDEVYPNKMPPLRNDRDTVVIGKGQLTEPFAVEVAGHAANKPISLKWNVTPAEANDDNAYLASLVEMARPSSGVELPTVGSAGIGGSQASVERTGARTC